MSTLSLVLTSVLTAAAGLLVAAGAYTEAHRVADQP